MSFDHDFFPAPTYLAEIERGFMAWSDIAMASEVVADGIIGMGLDIDEARRLLGRIGGAQARSSRCRTVTAATFAVRLSAAREVKERLDERLLPYGRLEDVDFRRTARGNRPDRQARRGAWSASWHQQGCQSAVRVGYSQIAEPIYLSLTIYREKAPALGFRRCTSLAAMSR